jgi:hypothetical protein
LIVHQSFLTVPVRRVGSTVGCERLFFRTVFQGGVVEKEIGSLWVYF